MMGVCGKHGDIFWAEYQISIRDLRRLNSRSSKTLILKFRKTVGKGCTQGWDRRAGIAQKDICTPFVTRAEVVVLIPRRNDDL